MTTGASRYGRVVVTVATLALTMGCVHRRPRTATEQWIGHTEQELIESWGKPDETIRQADGTHLSTWLYRYSEFAPGQAPIDRVCRRSFAVAPSGKLLKWSIEGDCAAH